MTNVAPDEARQGEALQANHVAGDFTRIYYHVLNDNPEFLHQFYGHDSSITVSETQDDGSNITVRADNLELIKALTLRMFADVRVTLTNCTPQTSLGGSVQLMVSGVMHQRNCDEERLFTQAMLLAKQEQGYYVLNDTVHVHSRSSSWKVLNFERREEGGLVQKQTQTEAEATPQTEGDTGEEDPQTAEEPAPAPAEDEVVPVTEAVPVEMEVEVEVGPQQSPGFEDAPVEQPVNQNVTPIEKPVQTPTPVSTPSQGGRRSYRDALKLRPG